MSAERNISQFVSRPLMYKMFPSLLWGLVNSFYYQLPPPLTLRPHSFLPLPPFLLLSSSSHHICFSSCSIPVFLKRIVTCGSDELTHQYTLLLSVPFLLFHYLILFPVSQSLPLCPNRYTQERHTQIQLHNHNTHASWFYWLLVIMWPVCVVFCFLFF